MLDKGMPLRYKISSWRQLPDCLSNNSKLLHIHLSDFINNRNLLGFRITVEHDTFGTLFACVLNASGDIITPGYDYVPYELSPDAILKELEKFGYFITYEPVASLPGNQIEYLITLRGLGYDKLRKLSVWKNGLSGKESSPVKLVAFQSDPHGDWLNNAYCPSDKEFYNALMDGTAANLTEICKTKKFRWDWLDFVANIDDIIKENADEMIHY